MSDRSNLSDTARTALSEQPEEPRREIAETGPRRWQLVGGELVGPALTEREATQGIEVVEADPTTESH